MVAAASGFRTRSRPITIHYPRYRSPARYNFAVTRVLQTVEDQRIVAVATGTSDDPFAVLGRHRHRRSAVRPSIVRTMQPAASAVELVTDGAGHRRCRGGIRTGCSRRALPLDGRRVGLRLPLPRARRRLARARSIDPYQFGQVLTDFDLHLFSEGTHYRAWEKLGAHVHDDRRRHRRALRRVGAERAARQRHRRLQPLGRPRAPDAAARAVGRLGDLRSRSDGRRLLQVRGPHAGGTPAQKADPYARRFEVPPQHGVDRLDRAATTSGATTTGCATGRRSAAGTSGRCRSTRCTSARGAACRRRATGT